MLRGMSGLLPRLGFENRRLPLGLPEAIALLAVLALVQQTAIAIPPARESSQSSYLVFFLATFLVAVFFVF